jgi:hypothetical protein
MEITVEQERKELLKEIKSISSEKIREILDFVYFIKTREAIDPAQMYFWTRQWQIMEQETDSDKASGRIIGDGGVKDLLKKLKK